MATDSAILSFLEMNSQLCGFDGKNQYIHNWESCESCPVPGSDTFRFYPHTTKGEFSETESSENCFAPRTLHCIHIDVHIVAANVNS